MIRSDLPDPQADVSSLRAFVAVARLGTVGRAAHALARTQPSISARLARLERAWGTRLFRRAPRGMVLTPEGARLLPLAEASLRNLEELDRTAGLPVASSAELRIGAGDALGRVVLPRALARLLRAYPGVEVYLREGPGPRLIEALREGEIDLAFVVAPEGAGEGIEVEPWIGSEIDLLAPAGLLEGRPGRKVRLRELEGQRLVVLQPGSGFRRHLEQAFREAGVPFRPAIEVGNLSLVRRFVTAGLGLAPVPAVAFTSDRLGQLERRRLTGVPPLTYSRAERAGAPRAAIALELLRAVRA